MVNLNSYSDTSQAGQFLKVSPAIALISSAVVMASGATTLLTENVTTKYDVIEIENSIPLNYQFEASAPVESQRRKLNYIDIETLKIKNNIFEFENRDEVYFYFSSHNEMEGLFSALPYYIEEIMGEVLTKLSIFKDIEEDWENLVIQIKLDRDIDDLMDMEDALVKLIEQNFSGALKYITVSCV